MDVTRFSRFLLGVFFFHAGLTATADIKPPQLPRAFGAIIPLGLRCKTTTQLIRLGLRTTNYGLEWCISPATSVAQLILNDFEGFLEADNFVFFPESSRGKIAENHMLDERYGLMLTHDFSLNANLSPTEREALKQKEFEAVKQKLGRRINRFLTTLAKAEESSAPILFIRFKGTTPDEAQLLVSAISTRYPGLDFTLLVLDDSSNNNFKIDWKIPHVINRIVPHDIDGWMPIFAEVVDFSKQVLSSVPWDNTF